MNELKPGFDLDREVAEKVMGWKFVSDSDDWAIGWNGSSISDTEPDRPVRAFNSFSPSTNRTAMMEVVHKMMDAPDRQREIFFHDIDFTATKALTVADTTIWSETADPLRICLAALKAVGAV